MLNLSYKVVDATAMTAIAFISFVITLHTHTQAHTIGVAALQKQQEKKNGSHDDEA